MVARDSHVPGQGFGRPLAERLLAFSSPVGPAAPAGAADAPTPWRLYAEDHPGLSTGQHGAPLPPSKASSCVVSD